MRFRKDKGDGAGKQDTVETPALTGAALGGPPPSASDRVDEPTKVLPPPSVDARVEEPSANEPSSEPAKVLPPSGSERVDAPDEAPEAPGAESAASAGPPA